MNKKKIFEILINVKGFSEKEKLSVNGSVERIFETLKLIRYRPKSKIKILDVGPGRGDYDIIYRTKYPHAEITVLDLDSAYKPRFDMYGVTLVEFDLTSGNPLPFKSESFDLICFNDVIEHLPSHHHHIMDEFHRVLKNKGNLILGTPNITSLYKRINFLFGKTPLKHYKREKYQDHIHEFDVTELKSLLIKAGFKIDKVKMCPHAGFGSNYKKGSISIYYWVSKVIYILASLVMKKSESYILIRSTK